MNALSGRQGVLDNSDVYVQLMIDELGPVGLARRKSLQRHLWIMIALLQVF